MKDINYHTLFTITSMPAKTAQISKNDIKRLACFDKLYPKINEKY